MNKAINDLYKIKAFIGKNWKDCPDKLLATFDKCLKELDK